MTKLQTEPQNAVAMAAEFLREFVTSVTDELRLAINTRTSVRPHKLQGAGTFDGLTVTAVAEINVAANTLRINCGTSGDPGVITPPSSQLAQQFGGTMCKVAGTFWFDSKDILPTLVWSYGQALRGETPRFDPSMAQPTTEVPVQTDGATHLDVSTVGQFQRVPPTGPDVPVTPGAQLVGTAA